MDEIAQAKNIVHIEPPAALKALSPRMSQFCQHYVLEGRNVLRAATLAGYAVSREYHGQAYDLMKRADIQAGIAYYEALFASRTHYTAEKIIHEWSTQAAFDMTELLNKDWSLKELDKLQPDIREALRTALVGVEVVEKANGSRTVKPKFDKSLARQELAKLLKLYETEKDAAQGMNLSISIGQQVVTTDHAAEPIGHINIDIDNTDDASS